MNRVDQLRQRMRAARARLDRIPATGPGELGGPVLEEIDHAEGSLVARIQIRIAGLAWGAPGRARKLVGVGAVLVTLALIVFGVEHFLHPTVLPGVPMVGGNVALANGVAYYVTEQGTVALDASDGKQLWSAPLSPGAKIYSGAAIAGHRLVVNDYGSIQVFLLPG